MKLNGKKLSAPPFMTDQALAGFSIRSVCCDLPHPEDAGKNQRARTTALNPLAIVPSFLRAELRGPFTMGRYLNLEGGRRVVKGNSGFSEKCRGSKEFHDLLPAVFTPSLHFVFFIKQNIVPSQQKLE